MSKTLLFVDDEPLVLDGLENMLFEHSDYQILTAQSGAEALKLLEEKAVDVIISDMRMPVMTGDTLLSRVKDKFPNVIRIVLSGHVDINSLLKAMPVAHQYLAKPCEVNNLISTLERSCYLQELINDQKIREMVNGLSNLPSQPKIYQALLKQLQSKDCDIFKIAEILNEDIALCTKILQIANSPLFSVAQPVTEVSRAVSILGIQIVTELVLGLEVMEDCRNSVIDVEKLNVDGQLVGGMAASVVDKRNKESAFLSGYLHGVGRMILASSKPDEYKMILELKNKKDISIEEAEQTVLGISQEKIGTYMLGVWGLPYSILEAVCHYTSPAEIPHDRFNHIGAVHVSVCYLQSKQSGEEPKWDQEYLRNLNVLDQVDNWVVKFEEVRRGK